MNKKESKEKKEKVTIAGQVVLLVRFLFARKCFAPLHTCGVSPRQLLFIPVHSLFTFVHHFCASCHNIFFIPNDKTTTKS
jgi:hypothetical protein